VCRGELGEGREGELWAPGWGSRVGPRKMALELDEVCSQAFLDQKKGRVRFLGLVEAHECRGRGQRGS
jgi:hypothetical protein